MKAVRCPNGHWYDSETYSQCPHCGQSGSTPKKSAPEAEKPEKKRFFLFKKEKKPTPMAVAETPAKPAVPAKVESNHSATRDEVTERFFADIDDDKTVSMFEANGSTLPDPASKGMKEKEPSAQKWSTSEPLAAAVQRISAMDEGRTLSYFNAMTAQKESSYVQQSTSKTAEPVVGWLVAISGVHLGESFQLYAGKNTIGRNSSNRVVLALDQSVSRENQATIIYEPKRREFYLQSGNSDGLVYLNDSFMTGSQLLKEKDVVEVGTSKLVFIPLCGTDFSWEQYM